MKIKIDHLYSTRNGYKAHVLGLTHNICRAYRVAAVNHCCNKAAHVVEYEVYHDGTAFMGYDWGRSAYVRGFDLMEDITDANV